jgi:Response regulator containing CheY-like receiver, AAA-type ATPase, and DNA-binding domains
MHLSTLTHAQRANVARQGNPRWRGILRPQSLKNPRSFVTGECQLYEFAESAAEALEIIDEFCEDEVNILVIVSDWLMPGMKGDELLIKIHQKYPQIVTVMLTGKADQAAIERTKN